MTTITLISAVALNGVIGRDGDMPWYLPTDLKIFKAATLGKPVIMGRRTLEAIGKALPGRENIIVSRSAALPFNSIVQRASLDDALALARERCPALGVEEIMVAGGGEIYRQAMPLADCLKITRVLAEPEGDAYFPEIDANTWILREEEDIETEPRDTAGLRRQVYERRA